MAPRIDKDSILHIVGLLLGLIWFDPPLGRRIALRPDEYTTDEIIGELVFADRDEIAIHRIDPSLGDVVVHFPRVGYALRQI